MSLLAIPTGCAPTTDTAATDIAGPRAAFCQLSAPITWSRADSDATIRAVKAHNAAYDALCRPP
jgi:hypothetical protein